MKLYAIGKQPIAEDSPAGEDIRNSEDFEALRSEIGKLSMPSNDGQSIDWEHVRELSTVILTDQSKDLFVAAYLAGALIELDGLQGLADGAGMLRDMTHHFWDDMHPPPKRMRGRINAYTWWKERALAYLKSFTPDSPQPGELLDSLQTAISELDAELGDKANDAPPLKDILGLVQRIPAQEPQPGQ
ncbi:MAG: type VI secretion system ImpA family N-terminal domain-containing protein, partial [Desulfovermiculus sp.]